MMPKDEMRAVVIDRFGGPETLSVRTAPVPEPKPDQILMSQICRYRAMGYS
jgi:D-arabinose 1-dehydrogenase-like Zn-dependent alcohol dehydrogenase